MNSTMQIDDDEGQQLRWALASKTQQITHITAIGTGTALMSYYCPCCRRPVMPAEGGYIHGCGEDCNLRFRPPWNTDRLSVFHPDDVKGCQRFVRQHLVSIWSRVNINCVCCGSICPAVHAGGDELIHTEGYEWRGLILDIGVIAKASSRFVGGVVLVDSPASSIAVSLYIQEMVDTSDIRIFVLLVDRTAEASSLFSDGTDKMIRMDTLPVFSMEPQTHGSGTGPGVPQRGHYCSVCHLVNCVEPTARQRIWDGIGVFISNTRPVTTVKGITTQNSDCKHDPRSEEQTIATKCTSDRSKFNAGTAVIRKTEFGDVAIVVNPAVWPGLTKMQQIDTIRSWWEGDADGNTATAVIGLWCLRCAACTRGCKFRIDGRNAANRNLTRSTVTMDSMARSIKQFDNSNVLYGPRIGIQRRQRLLRYLCLHSIQAEEYTPLHYMILECDTIGLYRYKL